MKASKIGGAKVFNQVVLIDFDGFVVEIFSDSGGYRCVGQARSQGRLDGLAAVFAKFGAGAVCIAFKDFDAIVGVGIMGGGDVDSDIKTHLGETIINGGGRKNADVAVFDAESFEGGF